MYFPVLIPRIFNYPLTYCSDNTTSLKEGDFVIVPFGKSKEVGVIWDKVQPTPKNIKIRSIEKKLEKISINRSLISFINWFSMYNLVSKGMVLKMCIGNKSNLLKIEKKINIEILKKRKKFFLNKEQNKSLKNLQSYGNTFNVSVLQGVTGSGKTLVYFERIKDILNKKKQVLIMLPEIFLTKQFQQRFMDFFGFVPAVWHSKITTKNKRKIWQGILNNKIKLVIGARSSLFLPFKKLGLIIVDEEHDQSYKQGEGLIYNARDMAISRASFENVPIHLVSSIPSLETFNNIEDRKYNLTKISKRYSDFPLPDTEVVNLNYSSLKKDQFIAFETLELVKKYLNKGEQVLFFLNRRGYAPFLICKKCGFKHICPHCSIYLTYHKLIKKLVCHYCGFKNKKEVKCKTQKNCDFQMYGPGVERIYDELKEVFPNKITKIISSDFLLKKSESENILKKIEKNEINILIGTQLISKGFNFPKLNCIVVVDADFSGMGYDLRTTEKNIQLYNQLSGRAGRFSNKSLVIYQTYFPLNETLKDLISNDPEKFLKNELLMRKKNNLPPFSRLIALIVSSKSNDNSLRGAQEIKKKLIKIRELKVLGPISSPVFKIRKYYRTRLLLKTESKVLIQKKLALFLQNLQISKKIKLTVDVDPINFT